MNKENGGEAIFKEVTENLKNIFVRERRHISGGGAERDGDRI